MQSNNIRGNFTPFDASKYKVAIVNAQFNTEIVNQLTENALEKLKQYQVPEDNIKIFSVPGCVEIPLLLEKAAQTKKYDCLIAIGVVIQGDTPHFEYVCKIASEGIQQVTLTHTIPVGFGILTLNNQAQATERIRAGGDAVEAALQSAKLIKKI